MNYLPPKKAVAPGARRFADVRLEIEQVPLGDLHLPTRMVRDHSPRQVKLLARSLQDFGAVIPAVTDRTGTLVTGAAVVAAARKLGWTDFPVIRITHLDDHQLRLFRIAHSKLAEGASWNEEALRLEFEEIAIERPDLKLGSSGFQIAERDIIYGKHKVAEMADLDEEVAPKAGLPVSQLGDMFKLGRHAAVCGSATDPEVVRRATQGLPVRMLASDLPYNVKIAGNVSGLGKNKHGEFKQASGEMDRGQFITFLASAFAAAQPLLVNGALLYAFMDWRHLLELQTAAEQCSLRQLNLLVWAKTNAGMGSLYRSAHEMIGVFKHGDEPHINNVELGRHGRNRTNVIHMPGVNTFGKGRNKALESHPTVKPVGLIADLVLDASGPGDLVLDPFAGSGSTLIAAEKTDRTAALVELDPVYMDVICRRYEALTGDKAVHVETGLPFQELARARAEERR